MNCWNHTPVLSSKEQMCHNCSKVVCYQDDALFCDACGQALQLCQTCGKRPIWNPTETLITLHRRFNKAEELFLCYTDNVNLDYYLRDRDKCKAAIIMVRFGKIASHESLRTFMEEH